MKAIKVMVTIKTETLSLDSVPSLLMDVANQLRGEKAAGSLKAEDGDYVEWSTIMKDVEF